MVFSLWAIHRVPDALFGLQPPSSNITAFIYISYIFRVTHAIDEVSWVPCDINNGFDTLFASSIY